MLVASVACSSSPSEPTQQVAQISGTWSFTAQNTGVTGGECVGVLLEDTIGTRWTGTLQIAQSGNALTATTTEDRKRKYVFVFGHRWA